MTQLIQQEARAYLKTKLDESLSAHVSKEHYKDTAEASDLAVQVFMQPTDCAWNFDS